MFVCCYAACVVRACGDLEHARCFDFEQAMIPYLRTKLQYELLTGAFYTEAPDEGPLQA